MAWIGRGFLTKGRRGLAAAMAMHTLQQSSKNHPDRRPELQE
jgi:hypothetical protein